MHDVIGAHDYHHISVSRFQAIWTIQTKRWTDTAAPAMCPPFNIVRVVCGWR